MVELVVRESQELDQKARRNILDSATRELRKVYRPRESGCQCSGEPSGVLVALIENTLVGTAEYVRKERHVYVLGVAVRPEYRGRGVCRALLQKAEEIAIKEGVAALSLCAIEETGNVRIFEKLGFKVTNRTVARNHVSLEGGPVTQADMERNIA